MGSLGQEILAVNLCSHYYVGSGEPSDKSELQLSFSCKLEIVFCGNSFVNKYFEYIYMSSGMSKYVLL